MKPLVLLAVFALASGALANEPAVEFKVEPVFPSVLGGSVVGEAGRMEGNVFSVFPLNDLIGWGPQVQDTVLFVQPLVGWQEGGSTTASLGLGFRKLFGDPTQGHSKLATDIDLFGEGWYLGGNVFADWMQSPRGLGHWQASAGVEVGSRYLSFHANYYWPLTKEKRWGQNTTRQIDLLGSTTTRSSSGPTLFIGPEITSGPLAGTHDIHVDTSYRDVTKLRLRTTDFTFGFYEEALRGWDASVDVLVPKLDRYVDLRLRAGLYGFHEGEIADGFHGWLVGAELRPVPAVALMASCFEDGRHDEPQWLVGVRFEVPLGHGTKDAFKVRRRTLHERVTEPVVRQYQPTVADGVRLDQTKSKTSTAVVASNVGSTANRVVIDMSVGLPVPGDALMMPDGTFVVVEADGKALRVIPASSVVDGYRDRWGETRVWTGYGQDSRPIQDGEHLFAGWVGNVKYIPVVPEPSRICLVLLGLAFAGLRRRRSV
jgi:hypothetical protein